MAQDYNGLQKSHEPFWFLFLAGIYALITFTIFLSFQIPQGVTKNDDFNFYILGWAFFVPLGLGLAEFTKRVYARFLNSVFSSVFIATFFNFSFLLYQLWPRAWGSRSNWIQASEFLLLQCGIFLILNGIQLSGRQLSVFLEKSLMVLMVLFFSIWVFFLSVDTLSFFKNNPLFKILFLICFVFLLYASVKRDSEQKPPVSSKREIFFYLAALFYIFLLVIDPNFGFNQYHYSFFLGPLADFRAGKSFLANINSQYGLLIFYFLSLFFKVLPLGYKSFCLVLTFLYVLQYFCFYFIARQLFTSRLFSMMTLTVLLIVNYFATMGRMTEYPSVGPLRFGFIYLLMMLVILRNQYTNYRKYFYIAESLVVALAVFWSFEVCVYTLPAYLGLILYESTQRENDLKFDKTILSQRLFLLGGFCLFIFIFIYGDVYRRTQDWPHWFYYFDYVFLYKNGFGMLFVPGLGGWWLIVGILLISLLAVWSSLIKKYDSPRPPHFNAIALLTFYGIFQFFYFAGRAHPNNLFHISMPAVLLGAYWLFWLGKAREESAIPFVMRKSVLILGALGLGFYLQLLMPSVASKMDQNLALMPFLPQRALAAAQDLPREDDFAQTAGLLMTKYSGDQKRVIYLLGDKGLDVSMYTGRVNAFPYNDVPQVSICPQAIHRVVFFNPPVSVGEYVYFSKVMDQSYYDTGDGKYYQSPLEKILLYKLTHGLDLKLIEEQKGIAVYQVMGEKKITS